MSLSKSAKYYRENPIARALKNKYQSKFNQKPAQVKKRVELNKINRKAQAAGTARKNDGLDYDHKTKRMVKASVNRGRKGEGNR